jgi:hypothetical protein
MWNYVRTRQAGRDFRRELLCVGVLLLVGAFLGSWYLVLGSLERCTHLPRVTAVANAANLWGNPRQWCRRATGTPDHYLASVMLASGKGFVLPANTSCPALADFVALRAQTLDKNALPPDLPTLAPDIFAEQHRYLLYSIGGLWRLFGISWVVLRAAMLFVFGVTLALAYALCRFGMRRWISVVAVVPFALVAMPELSNPRDYGKTPFLLGVLVLLGLLMRRPRSRRLYFAVAFGLGVVQGIGLGFREDLVMALFPSAVVLGACSIAVAHRKILTRCAGIALMLAGFALTSWPILLTYLHTQSVAPDAILGLATSYDDAMGLKRTSYERMVSQQDLYGDATFETHAQRVRLEDGEDLKRGENADFVRLRFLFDCIQTFPADMLARAYAAAWRSIGGLFVPALVLLLISLRNPRLAALLLFGVLYFGAYNAIQFQSRHFFHQAIVPLWCRGVLARTGDRLFSGSFAGYDFAVVPGESLLVSPGLRAGADPPAWRCCAVVPPWLDGAACLPDHPIPESDRNGVNLPQCPERAGGPRQRGFQIRRIVPGSQATGGNEGRGRHRWMGRQLLDGGVRSAAGQTEVLCTVRGFAGM